MCGDMTAGKRNRLSYNLERRAFLRIHKICNKYKCSTVERETADCSRLKLNTDSFTVCHVTADSFFTA